MDAGGVQKMQSLGFAHLVIGRAGQRSGYGPQGYFRGLTGCGMRRHVGLRRTAKLPLKPRRPM